VMRHGARFPLKSFEHVDSWPNYKTFWELYGGKLTMKGGRQLEALGAALRNKLLVKERLLDEDDPTISDQVYVYTSNTDRTLMSAQGFLMGLLPSVPQSFQHAKEDSKKGDASKDAQADGTVDHAKAQHVAIHIADLDSEYTPLLHGYKESPRYDMLKARSLGECKWFAEKAQDPEWQALLQKIWRITGFAKMNPAKFEIAERIKHFQSLAQQIGIERAHDMQIFRNSSGETLDPADEAKILESADRCCRLRYQGNTTADQLELARLAAGSLPATIVSTLEQVAQGESDRKLSVYSAHDNTIMALLAHMGFVDWAIPAFGAYIAVELWEGADGSWSVRLMYNQDPGAVSPEECPCPSAPLLKIVPEGKTVQYQDAEQGEMSLEEFSRLLMKDRSSFQDEAAWRAGSQLSADEAQKHELQEAKAQLEKVNKKLEKLQKEQKKATELAEKIACLESKL